MISLSKIKLPILIGLVVDCLGVDTLLCTVRVPMESKLFDCFDLIEFVSIISSFFANFTCYGDLR